MVNNLLFPYFYEGTHICPLLPLHFAFLFSQNALCLILFVYICSFVTEGEKAVLHFDQDKGIFTVSIIITEVIT